MKKQFNVVKTVVVVVFLLPLLISWLPCEWFEEVVPESFVRSSVPAAVKHVEKPAVDSSVADVPSSAEAAASSETKTESASEVKKEPEVKAEPQREQLNAGIQRLEQELLKEMEAQMMMEEESSDSESLSPAPSIEKKNFLRELFLSFRELSITLVTTMIFAMIMSYIIGYCSVLSMRFGRGFANVLNAIESIPSILIALFCYAPVSGALAKTSGSTSSTLSLIVFIFAATATVLPEAVRSISIPLSDLYNRKYSVSFRSYGFTKNRILSVLMRTSIMVDTLKRVAAGILLKTLVLDTSFGFVIQVGLGATGTPSHTSPGALIATYRQTVLGLGDGDPLYFWVPSIFLIMISVAFLIVLNDNKEDA
ncbi:MAG: hypothetical protein IJ717_02815 [Treponema sp.]|nr:hypothetical protein [Treponema sp.]